MTKKPFSTVSFNTVDFLQSALLNEIEKGTISLFCYIQHFAEADTKKDHIHLFMLPSRPLDPVKFRNVFNEPVFGDKDLRCLPFQQSKFHDWLLYSLHDADYLGRKGLFRVNHYQLKDVVTNEPEFLEQEYIIAKESLTDNRMILFLDMIKNGSTFGDILRAGIVPPNQIVYWEKVYKSSFHLRNANLDEMYNQTIPF